MKFFILSLSLTLGSLIISHIIIDDNREELIMIELRENAKQHNKLLVDLEEARDKYSHE